MSRTPVALALSLCLAAAAACAQPGSPATPSPAGSPQRPSILAQPPPAVHLRPAADAILGDQVVGAARRGGHDHLTAALAASEQPDQAAALAEFEGWGWLDGASRTWASADETLVIAARADQANRAFGFWAGDAAGQCSATAAAGLDDCSQAVSGDRVVVVGRLASAVFRLQCPAAAAERLTVAQSAALHS
jgi:hypothetical protein